MNEKPCLNHASSGVITTVRTSILNSPIEAYLPCIKERPSTYIGKRRAYISFILPAVSSCITLPEAPLDNDVDFAFIAKQFRITGGNIKNIALGAAFLAAQNGNIINMNNIIRATKREYQKMGKLCTEDEFAEYMDLVK